jgi:hypothetical protein
MEELTLNPDITEVNIQPEGWTTPPTLKTLKDDLDNSQSNHDNQVTKIQTWLDNLHVTGTAKVKTPEGSSSVQPKLIRKQAEWRYAALSEPFLASDDLYDLKPVTWEDVESARQNKLLLNHQINTKIDKVAFVDEYVRAGVDEGTIITKVAWDFEEKEVEKRVPEVTFIPKPELLPLFQELNQLQVSDPTSYNYQVPEELKMAHAYVQRTGIPVEPQITGYTLKKEMKTVRNNPSLEVCDYRNVVVDPSCRGDASKAQFIIHSFETSLSELKKETGKYTNLEHINLTSASPLGEPDHDSDDTTDFNFSDDARKRIVAYEYWGYWDYDDSGIAKPFVATWVNNVLIRLEESPFPDGKLPFVIVPLLPVRNSVYGEPDGELLIENQKIIGAVTRGMIDIMGKSANGQMGIRKDALDATNMRKFQKGKDYQYNGGVDPRMSFYMHTYPEIPQSAQYMINLQNNEAESMTGVKAFANGISSDGLGDVATGIRGALDAASKRETGILRRLAKGWAEIGRKIIAMNAEFLDDEEIIRVTNEEFVAIHRDQLAGDHDLKVDVSSLEEDNIKAQELAFMLQTMGPNIDPSIAMKILTKIARLRKMPDLAKEFEDYQPQPDPMQQQMQQLEMQEKLANIAKIAADVQNTETTAILNKAKTLTEAAKARQLGSDADIKDLDFIEQESGVKQEREKELHGEQARSNMQLEQFKHNLAEKSKRTEQLDQYLKVGT